MYTFTYLAGTVKLIDKCQGKISYDNGETWWPKGPYELHILGDTYVLLRNGKYHKLDTKK